MSDQPFGSENVALPDFEPREGMEPVELKSVRADLGLDLPIVKAEDLVDSTFIIRKAKVWESTLKHGGVVYFCTCASFPDGELFNTNLGGDAVVEILSKAFAAGVVAPLKVTLRKISGGKFGRYYILE